MGNRKPNRVIFLQSRLVKNDQESRKYTTALPSISKKVANNKQEAKAYDHTVVRVGNWFFKKGNEQSGRKYTLESLRISSV